MFIWILILIMTMVTAFIFYSHRYTNKVKIWGLYSVQFFNLFVGSPLVLLVILNIALDIVRRPEIEHITLSSNILFALLGLSIISTAIGNGIHSTSTSVSEAFPQGVRTKAFLTNEVFHRYLSHELGNLGGIGIAVFLGLLETNHPAQVPEFGLLSAALFGIVIGILAATYIVRGTFVGLSLFASFFGLIFMSIALYPLYDSGEIVHYPISVMAFAAVAAVFVLLITTSLIVLFSDRLSKRLVKFIFPKGHPMRESFHL